MKGSGFNEEQILGVLREHEAGAKTEEVCRRHGISSATLQVESEVAWRGTGRYLAQAGAHGSSGSGSSSLR